MKCTSSFCPSNQSINPTTAANDACFSLSSSMCVYLCRMPVLVVVLDGSKRNKCIAFPLDMVLLLVIAYEWFGFFPIRIGLVLVKRTPRPKLTVRPYIVLELLLEFQQQQQETETNQTQNFRPKPDREAGGAARSAMSNLFID